MSAHTVVKVGGSLFDHAELGPRLRRFLEGLTGPLLLVPGGGPTANVVRDLDRYHGLGEERAHWLALHALRMNAHFLRELLPPARIVSALPEWRDGERDIAILDALAFAEADEGRSGCLPHVWQATSDSAAARVAVVTGARALILLKSTPIPAELGWAEAGRRGLVDPLFAGIVAQAPGLEIQAVNLRTDEI